ncbi:hypothetical protein [Mycolicibacterium brisbanense]|uniref:Gp58 n=1 Tax=Mycolicibacterium brisbanense TaxID=146020 RepID=A0A100W2U9_9MYCO|nr:hypothetical protein [Mycolicibacterium brisbanense]MCV7158462.1 hypothetical protein [Mycolicibacterium brisbanense]GAS90486.1 Gp58 [Mycolicibacterium brisbanense]
MSARAAILTTAAVAAGVAVGVLIAAPIDTGKAAPAVEHSTGTSLTFADLLFAATGTEPVEGDPAFDCRRHGDHICGPGNPQGVPPGVYRVTTAVDLGDLMVPAIAGQPLPSK